jgi:WD40 repeat protein
MDGGEDGQVKLWDSQRDSIKTFASTNTGPVWFDRNGSARQFVSISNGVCRILNLETGETQREFSAGAANPADETAALTVSEDGRFCAVAF